MVRRDAEEEAGGGRSFSLRKNFRSYRVRHGLVVKMGGRAGDSWFVFAVVFYYFFDSLFTSHHTWRGELLCV